MNYPRREAPKAVHFLIPFSSRSANASAPNFIPSREPPIQVEAPANPTNNSADAGGVSSRVLEESEAVTQPHQHKSVSEPRASASR